ncbi:SHOCT domain-containing protein [Arthrobacter mobilis]|uniref:SHOCT domain-containing protein n=1 Tax=Arthrobacter mobilis TaxID=2724944 RepID=A0A7X6K2M3_9MICC|nr:SHOCT domain-containing protein [Arthrobacter mobilis]NKX53347.1 SHOCT domain-containing protein [Arthrobacter mobilis]
MLRGNWFEMGWAWVFALLLLAIIALLATLVVRAFTAGTSRPGPEWAMAGHSGGRVLPPPRSPARQILDQRFARGELSVDEYNEHLKVLGEPPYPAGQEPPRA